MYPALLASIATNHNYTIFVENGERIHLININEPQFTQADLEEIDESAQKTTFYLYTR